MKIALVVSVFLIVQFPDGSTMEEAITMTTRPNVSMETCERNAAIKRRDLESSRLWRAFQLNAKIQKLEIEHFCVEETTDV